MNRLRCAHLCVASLLALSAAGCPSGRSEPPPREAPAASSLSAAPAAARLEAFYPVALGRFTRVGVQKYDGEGNDASVRYRFAPDEKQTLIDFTAYFYPGRGADETLDEAVRAATKEVRSKNRGAKVLNSEPIEVKRDGEAREGRRVTFEFTHEFGGERQKVMSELYVYPGAPGRWVKYRIHYPADRAEEMQARAHPFAAMFPWPSGL